MGYKATVELACFKQHECVACSGKFAYVLQREITAEGNSKSAAQAAAQAQLIQKVENDVDLHPCPTCGLVQPEMVADIKSGRYLLGTIVGVIVLVLGLILGLADVVPISTASMIGLAGGVIVGLACASGVTTNPNADLSKNLQTAEEEVRSEQITVTEEGSGTVVEDENAAISGGHMFGLGLIGVAVLAALAPSLLSVVNGWPKNDSYPAVVGPGDTATIYFDQQITSINSMWSGGGTATIRNAEEISAPASVNAETKRSNWGNTISGKSVSNTTKAMYAEVTMPNDDSLAGKTLDLHIQISATFPFEMDGGFVDDNGEFQHSEQITLAAPGAGSRYGTSFWGGHVVAIVFCVVGGLALNGTASTLRGKANETMVAPISGDEEEEADSEEDEA